MSTASRQHSDPVPPRRDRQAAAATAQWQREVPEAIRSLGTLANADYADIVTAAIDALPAEPEQVIHETLQRMPRGLVLFIPFAQRVLLGLRLKLQPSPDYLLGWKIADRGDNWIRIEAASWFLTGHVVIHVDQRQISFASFIRYDRRLAAFVWPPVSLIHRQVALALVRGAVQAL
jgi:hypothetical protein